MLEAQLPTGLAEGFGTITGAVVGHDALDLYAQVRVVGDGSLEEGAGAGLALVRLDLGEGDARGIVDADMDELPADAARFALTGAVASDAMTYPLNLPSFLMSIWINSPGCSRS